ncbi:hypothetical protein BC829DRAFT_382146 [Chytridium lagenaria]|nr:hypothetical protein BC829DRAFT_382146 [Chytridium lagenaria]
MILMRGGSDVVLMTVIMDVRFDLRRGLLKDILQWVDVLIVRKRWDGIIELGVDLGMDRRKRRRGLVDSMRRVMLEALFRLILKVILFHRWKLHRLPLPLLPTIQCLQQPLQPLQRLFKRSTRRSSVFDLERATGRSKISSQDHPLIRLKSIGSVSTLFFSQAPLSPSTSPCSAMDLTGEVIYDETLIKPCIIFHGR